MLELSMIQFYVSLHFPANTSFCYSYFFNFFQVSKRTLQANIFLNATRHALIELSEFKNKIKSLRNELLLNFIVVGTIDNINMFLCKFSCDRSNNFIKVFDS